MKILISGPPRSGKSTLIDKLINELNHKEYAFVGFFTPEVKKDGKREGFDIKDIKTQERIPLARKKGAESNFTLGTYKVYVGKFNVYLQNVLFPQLKEQKSHKKILLIIDEIGKMELFSELFQGFIRSIFQSNYEIIATIGKTLNHPIKDKLLNYSQIKLFSLKSGEFDEIFNRIRSYFN